MYRRPHMQIPCNAGRGAIMSSDLQKEILRQLAAGHIPAEIPDNVECADEIRQLAGFMKELEQVMFMLSQGSLSFEFQKKGPFAGAIKTLHANLRHLTWQTQQVARGDFTQRVDFMGEFAEAFNTMVDKLKESREVITQKNLSLEKAYDELKAAQSQVIQQAKMASVGQLAAGMAHEINNPAGFILSNLNSLKKYCSNILEFLSMVSATIGEMQPAGKENPIAIKIAEQRAALKIDFMAGDMDALVKESMEGALRITQIVQSLISFSNIDSSPYKPADINSCIENALNMLHNELKDRVIIIKEYGDIPQTTCNIGQMNQVFMNLLLNAVNAIEAHGEIRIITQLDSQSIIVSFSDTGCGIPANIIDRIFEPFFTTRDVGKGKGLGLSASYDIIKKHNGDIRVTSQVGKGTTFIITIPVVSEAGQ